MIRIFRLQDIDFFLTLILTFRLGIVNGNFLKARADQICSAPESFGNDNVLTLSLLGSFKVFFLFLLLVVIINPSLDKLDV